MYGGGEECIGENGQKVNEFTWDRIMPFNIQGCNFFLGSLSDTASLSKLPLIRFLVAPIATPTVAFACLYCNWLYLSPLQF